MVDVPLSEEEDNGLKFRPPKQKKEGGFFANLFGCCTTKAKGPEGNAKVPAPLEKRQKEKAQPRPAA